MSDGLSDFCDPCMFRRVNKATCKKNRSQIGNKRKCVFKKSALLSEKSEDDSQIVLEDQLTGATKKTSGISDQFILRDIATKRKNEFVVHLRNLAVSHFVDSFTKELALAGIDSRLDATNIALKMVKNMDHDFEEACRMDIFSKNFNLTTSIPRSEIITLFNYEGKNVTKPSLYPKKDIKKGILDEKN